MAEICMSKLLCFCSNQSRENIECRTPMVGQEHLQSFIVSRSDTAVNVMAMCIFDISSKALLNYWARFPTSAESQHCSHQWPHFFMACWSIWITMGNAFLMQSQQSVETSNPSSMEWQCISERRVQTLNLTRSTFWEYIGSRSVSQISLTVVQWLQCDGCNIISIITSVFIKCDGNNSHIALIICALSLFNGMSSNEWKI